MSVRQWYVPFADARYPAVRLVTASDTPASRCVVVAPHEIDAYPKYVVRFSGVYAFDSEEEAGGTRYPFTHGRAPVDLRQSCARIWEDSPQATAFQHFSPRDPRGSPVLHYVMLGGDNTVGVVAGQAPTIEKIDGPRSLTDPYTS